VSGDAPQLLVIDVLDPRLVEPAGAGELRVLVEPTWGCVAVAAALDAGWSEVEISPSDDTTPIPLVSFEQRPPDGAVRCRVRSSDLADVAHGGELLGAPVIARPLAAMLAARIEERVTFVPAPCGERVAADAMWAVGMLIRVLLDELDDRSSTLTDAAGIAVTIALGAEDAATRLSTGARWARHLKRGGHPDDLRVAAAVDSIGVVPMLAREGDALVARVWGA
jgi:hypothetical protein